MNKVRAIAFYLPQFYPTKENDKWWGDGFTEWTNVKKAKPLFRGHYQPRIPTELGYYDLRNSSIREKQAQLAREAGIEGFCYWHYWFAGKRLLDRVFSEVVNSGNPDFPFCLCWANHSWYAKTWTPNVPDKLLIEQTYPGESDFRNHFYALLPAFKDERYIKVDGKLLFGVFAPLDVDIEMMSSIWNSLAKENGLAGFCFFAFAQGEFVYESVKCLNYNSVVLDPLCSFFRPEEMPYFERKWRSLHIHLGLAYRLNYSNYARKTLKMFKKHPECVPCINPNFDHSPRSQMRGQIIHEHSPSKWYNLIVNTIQQLSSDASKNNNLLFIKAWNEWGEGNYLEPDERYGTDYILSTKDALQCGK